MVLEVRSDCEPQFFFRGRGLCMNYNFYNPFNYNLLYFIIIHTPKKNIGENKLLLQDNDIIIDNSVNVLRFDFTFFFAYIRSIKYSLLNMMSDTCELHKNPKFKNR